MRNLFLLIIGIPLALAGLTCAPQDPNAHKKPDLVIADKVDPKPVEIPKHTKDRIDAALKAIRGFELLPEHGFWTVFHAILGVGPEKAIFFNTKTGERMKALDYICQGGMPPGLEFRRTKSGVDVVTVPGSGLAQGHQDQFIAEMAQWNMPLDKKFIIDGKEHTFADFARHARDRVSVDKKDNQELSWAIIIVAQYYGTDISWTNSKGERVHFDDVVRYEMTSPIKESPVCGGTHRLFGLTWAYHLHMAKGGKKTKVWEDVAKLTRDYIDTAKSQQNEDGAFSTDYFLKKADNRLDMQRRLHSTGHILEWLALALSDEEIRQPWVQNAANALATMLLEIGNRGMEGGALYHAVHGLEMYRTRLFGPSHEHPPLIPPPPK